MHRDSRLTSAAIGAETSERSDNSKRVFSAKIASPASPRTSRTSGEADADHLASHRMGSEAFQPGTSGSATTSEIEPLACVGCRSRKLKCDRTKPSCTRCRTLRGECVYPEARRKPTFKRKNVKEIEARLAQVESYLKEVNESTNERHENAPQSSKYLVGDGDWSFPTAAASFHDVQDPSQAQPAPGFGFADYAAPRQGDDGGEDYALMRLGYSESLPPLHIQEELNHAFFLVAHLFIPVVHSGRFYQSFYGGPLKRPPMSLQYAIWAMAATGHSKYDQYTDIFYKRTRQYIEADELKAGCFHASALSNFGHGEHFITVTHAQALCISAALEAKLMMFTRASTTCAKAVRLCQMMGLDRLDGDQDDLPPCLAPPTSWEELEERRRVFWGIFAADSHGSISTGWHALINPEDIMTRLPASEEAFASGTEEISPFLEETFNGAPYSAFAATIVVCQIFRIMLKHVHHCKPSDRPQDMLDGPFWHRHRALDNKLSSTFMFLPARFVLSRGMRDPGAIHMNLNLHAAVIILHQAALEKVEQYDLPLNVRELSLCRLRASAEEIVNIVKMTSHSTSIFKSALCALSLYCCITVYIYLAKQSPHDGFSALDRANLEITVQAMEAIGRKHPITNAFLQQAFLDIERNDLGRMLRFSTVDRFRRFFDGSVGSVIPLITRSSVSRHTKVTPVLPGRLPLNNPQGNIGPGGCCPMDSGNGQRSAEPGENYHGSHDFVNANRFQPVLGAVTRNVSAGASRAADFTESRKRRRPPDSFAASASFILPDRTTSSTSTSSPAQGQGHASSPDLSRSSHASDTTTSGPDNFQEEKRLDLRSFQEQAYRLWPAAQMPPMQNPLFPVSASEPLGPLSMTGYDDNILPAVWDSWAETTAWGSEDATAGPGPGSGTDFLT
ncbi:hypothetical protein E4U13_001248 [Claviceps humidiphila]|uniref:Zn(2)-C6 fungal-type domain-containing protein n=1 Tax=Claviceps humidiphila TaxID=1294629 RepID=A0A9P7TVC5_9HYPO|nr:hypothetical protein E4U13_001248 [Claviceps humidiphila]